MGTYHNFKLTRPWSRLRIRCFYYFVLFLFYTQIRDKLKENNGVIVNL